MKKITDLLGNSKIPELKKLFRIMKLTYFFILISVVSVLANKTYSQTKTLKLNLEKATVKEVLSKIEDQSEFYFMYSSKIIDVNREVSVNIKNKKIEKVLNSLFGGTDVKYTIEDRIIVLTTPEIINKDPLAYLQQSTVFGTVIDQNGQPLPGVTVIIKGTTEGTVTNADGDYSLSNILDGATLQFSFVGMHTQEIVVGTQTRIDVVMQEESIGLEEVIAIGYGTMKKLDISGSIVSTDAEVLREIPSASVTHALQGRLPGIEMLQTSTRPGAAMQIRIRGERSLNATNEPLIVVDGIPFAGSLNDIAPSDIKSVDILKDASATAIYGSRGANGVILISTFRGKTNTKASISYNGYYGIKTVAKEYPVYNGKEFMDFKHATVNSAYTDEYTALEQEMIDAGKETNWQDLMYSNAMVTNHDVSVSSGTEKGAFLFGGGYYNETAVLPGQEYTRYSLRTTIDQEIGEYINVAFNRCFSAKILS